MIRRELVVDVVEMALETLRANKLRSALTILGVVIGVTAVVGMTALVRGFDESMRSMLEALGPKTLFLAKFSGASIMGGESFEDLLKRPNLTMEDARAIRAREDVIARVDVILGGGFRFQPESIRYQGRETKPVVVIGASEFFADVNHVDVTRGRMFTAGELRRSRSVAVLGRAVHRELFPHVDPIGKVVRVGAERYEVVGIFGPRPSPGGFNLGQDEFVLVPFTSYARQYGVKPRRVHGQELMDVTIVAEPRANVSRDDAFAEVETILRVRHGLRVDDANDFDILTQETAGKVFTQVTSATFLAVTALSSIALVVGGIGVMATMTISVTERTGEIGLRKALGARRREILWQFLLEASFLTALGGVLGLVLGSAVGWLVHRLSGFPISLPWWSFALGLGFSAGVGLLFGTWPAVQAARLDPIEALRHE